MGICFFQGICPCHLSRCIDWHQTVHNLPLFVNFLIAWDLSWSPLSPSRYWPFVCSFTSGIERLSPGGHWQDFILRTVLMATTAPHRQAAPPSPAHGRPRNSRSLTSEGREGTGAGASGSPWLRSLPFAQERDRLRQNVMSCSNGRLGKIPLTQHGHVVVGLSDSMCWPPSLLRLSPRQGK